jgi:hypothetical protein
MVSREYLSLLADDKTQDGRAENTPADWWV